MSKTGIIAAVTAATLTAAAVPAALLSGGESSEEVVEEPTETIVEEKREEPAPVKQETEVKTDPKPQTKPEPSKPKKPFTKPTWNHKLIPQLASAKDIRKEYGKVGCLKNYFKEIKFDGASTSKPTSNDIKEFSNNSQSCLIVEYYKQTYTDGKWWGEFRLIWAVKDDTQGLITVTNARADKGSLLGGSSAYALKKNDSKDSWNAYRIKEISETPKKDDSLERLIPQATSSMPEQLDTTNYWGFDPNLQKICGINDCSNNNGSAIHNFYSWEFVRDSENSIVYFWASDINNWLEKIFDWQTFVNKMNKVRGTWKTKQSWSV